MTTRKATARPKSRPAPGTRASVERITYQPVYCAACGLAVTTGGGCSADPTNGHRPLSLTYQHDPDTVTALRIDNVPDF